MAADAVSGDLGVWQEDEGRQIVANAVKLAKEAVGADRKLSVKSELVFSTPVPTMVEISNEAEMVVLGSSGRERWPEACSVRSARAWCDAPGARSRSSTAMMR